MSSPIREEFPEDVIFIMNEVKNKLHPWRVCSKGFHCKGGTTQKLGKDPMIILPPEAWKCVKNSTGKDILHAEEIIVITGVYFPYLKGPPTPNNLDYPDGNNFDSLIRGWTRYWNDILKPDEQLDANLVKALVGSESGFQPNPKRSRRTVRGLMQIQEQSRKILGNLKGALKNHFIITNYQNILEPTINICSGIRWLFHKRRLASGKLGRPATWEEAVAEYKAYLKEYKKDPNHRGMGNFRSLYRRLSK